MRLLVAAVIYLFSAATLRAQTLGLGFWIDAGLGETSSQRQSIEKRLADQVSELNDFFRNSHVQLQAEIAALRYVDIPQKDAVTVLDDMISERNAFANLFAVAGEYGADYNIAIIDKLQLRGKPNCGRAYAVNKTHDQIASLKRAIAAVNSACSAQTLAHELGHLLGLNHGRLVDSCLPNEGHTSAIAPYASGYAQGNCDSRPQDGEFGTLMVGGYLQQINGDGHSALPFFSNPKIRDPRCGKQGICGNPEFADAARTLNENAQSYIDHAEPDVHVLNYKSPELSRCITERYRFKEIANMFELVCPNAAITSLEGLQQLSHLKRIDLSDNPLTDANALLNFPAEQMEQINLSNTDLEPTVIDKLHARFGSKIVHH